MSLLSTFTTANIIFPNTQVTNFQDLKSQWKPLRTFFFDIENFNLIGWQTNDIYQNSTLTLLSSISINKKIDKNLFILPTQN